MHHLPNIITTFLDRLWHHYIDLVKINCFISLFIHVFITLDGGPGLLIVSLQLRGASFMPNLSPFFLPYLFSLYDLNIMPQSHFLLNTASAK